MNYLFKSILALIGLLVFLVVVYLLQIAYWFFSLNYWDEKVTRYCEEEGRAVAYKTIQLTRDEAETYGIFRKGRLGVFPAISSMGRDARYYTESSTDVITQGVPELRRHTTSIIDREGGVVLGETVTFSRNGGGAIPSLAQSNYFGCSNLSPSPQASDLESKVFMIID